MGRTSEVTIFCSFVGVRSTIYSWAHNWAYHPTYSLPNWPYVGGPSCKYGYEPSVVTKSPSKLPYEDFSGMLRSALGSFGSLPLGLGSFGV